MTPEITDKLCFFLGKNLVVFPLLSEIQKLPTYEKPSKRQCAYLVEWGAFHFPFFCFGVQNNGYNKKNNVSLFCINPETKRNKNYM